MILAKQSTAIIVTVGPVLDADGVAVTDGVVGDFKASKNGGAPAALNGSATLTHRNTGHYSLSLTTTDTNTLGTLEIVIDDTVNACPMKEIMVLPANVYDSLVPGTDTLDVQVTGMGANVMTAAAAAADLTTELQNGLATAAELAKVPKSDSNVTWNATAAAQIQSEAADALNAYDPPTRAEATADKDEILADTNDIQSRLPAALSGGRMISVAQVVDDKTGYELTAAGNAAVADKLLGRTRAGGADGGRTVAQCLAFGRNKWTIVAGTLTVYADDDATPLYTAAVTTAAGDPVTSVDPA